MTIQKCVNLFWTKMRKIKLDRQSIRDTRVIISIHINY
jgi:hypothetical protein